MDHLCALSDLRVSLGSNEVSRAAKEDPGAWPLLIRDPIFLFILLRPGIDGHPTKVCLVNVLEWVSNIAGKSFEVGDFITSNGRVLGWLLGRVFVDGWLLLDQNASSGVDVRWKEWEKVKVKRIMKIYECNCWLARNTVDAWNSRFCLPRNGFTGGWATKVRIRYEVVQPAPRVTAYA